VAIQARTEFASALNQVCSERGLEPEVVIDSIKQAILAAYRKDYGDPEDIVVDLNAETGEVGLSKGKKNITPPGFGRIAAQTAKQVILQRIREAEKNAILSEYSSKVGTIVSGIIQRISGPIITVNLGKAEGIMPPAEQSQEKYFVNQRLKFYIVGIKEGARGEEIIVSRANSGLLEGLFRQEVPEIASGAVEIKAVAREAGSRSKIAVFSDQLGVDPVGSCVGQKGVRVQAVINELGDEKIDVIAYQEDLAEFVKSALSPAKDLQVKIKEKEKSAEVMAPDDQLSLAIGREGQNVRLAAKLTGYKIDIRGKSGTPKEVEAKEKAAQQEAKKALGVVDESPKPEKSDKTKLDKSRKSEVRETGTSEKKENQVISESDTLNSQQAGNLPKSDDQKESHKDDQLTQKSDKSEDSRTTKPEESKESSESSAQITRPDSPNASENADSIEPTGDKTT